MRVPKTLYIIADGGRARYVERTGPSHFRTFRKFVSANIHDKSSALGRDRPGRVDESATTARHAVGKTIDLRDKVEAGFVRSIAADLNEDPSIGDFDHLVFVAPAKLEKQLRGALSVPLAAKLVKCISKDLTKVPDSCLYLHLPVFLVSPAAT
jgi:protein required for attachment to host cells